MPISQNNKTSDRDNSIVELEDGKGTGKRAEVVTRASDGKDAVAIDGSFAVTINELLGKDPIPDTFGTITTAGTIGNTLRFVIQGTSVDTTSPDRDLAIFDKTFTVKGIDVGDEIQLRDSLVTFLNSEVTFRNAKLKAQAVGGTLRAILHITSTELSLAGEFAERPNAGDFAVTTSGTTVFTIDTDFDKVISRGKVISLARDPQNPHRLGILGISGTVSVFPTGLEETAIGFLKTSGGASDMRVDGSSTEVDFEFTNDLVDKNIFIVQIRLFGGGNGIKFGQFLSKNSALTNGLLLSVQTEGTLTTFDDLALKRTEDFKNLFATEPPFFDLSFQAGSDQVIAVLRPALPFQMAPGSSSFIRVSVRDDLTSGLTQLQGFVAGFIRSV